jgi:hypothetical protein
MALLVRIQDEFSHRLSGFVHRNSSNKEYNIVAVKKSGIVFSRGCKITVDPAKAASQNSVFPWRYSTEQLNNWFI